tara:strand:- start:6365 stop:6853 length:489 start_codon:yes stop_codon:yes gene_type:complete
MLFDQEKVKNFLPHREPFLFINSVESIKLENWVFGQRISNPKDAIGGVVTANFFTSESLDLFKGHFPGRPIFPGVIQVEAMAQASSFAMVFFIDNPFALDTLDIALARLEDTRFRKPVLPGQNLKIEAEVIKYRKPIIVTKCKVFNGEDVVSEATISSSVKF